MKKLIVDKFSPIKHICRMNPLGDITPVSSFARDYQINEDEWGDDYILVYAYRIYDNVKATDSEVLDHTEHGKHIEIYSDIAVLDGSLELEKLDTSSGWVPVTTRVEAHTLMNLLTAYLTCYKDEDVSVVPTIKELAKCLYKDDGFGISVQLPEHFKEFVGVE